MVEAILIKRTYFGKQIDVADWKDCLSNELKRLGLLTNEVEQIIINCNSGGITDVKPVLRLK